MIISDNTSMINDYVNINVSYIRIKNINYIGVNEII